MTIKFGGSQLETMEASAAAYVKGDIGARLFPRYLGAILDFILLGVVMIQFVTYARFIRTDKWQIRVIVISSMICAVAASICILLWFNDLFIKDFGHFLSISETYYWVRYGAIDTVTICIVQMFYIDRCCKLFRSWWPGAFLGGLSIVSVGFGCAFLSYTGMNYTYLADEVFEDQLVVILVYGWIGLIVVTDLAITITVIVGLRRARTGWSHTDSIIKRIIVRSCEIQLPGLIMALCTAALFAQPDESATFFFLIHTKVYVSGLLTCLNSRLAPSQWSKTKSYRSSHLSPGEYTHQFAISGTGPRSNDLENTGDMPMRDMGDTVDLEIGAEAAGGVKDGRRLKWEDEGVERSEFGSTTRLTPAGGVAK